jgi:hypothetical protein
MKTKKQNPEKKEITIDLPEVKDIPGQEHIRPPKMNEMADTTISSDDEEGVGLLDDLNEEDNLDLDDDTNVTKEELELLDRADRPLSDETIDVQKLALDEPDELNQESNPMDMGADLDVPGSELDDENEELGEEDEENNSYSPRD